MVDQLTDVATPGNEGNSEVTKQEIQEPAPEPTVEELKTKVQTIESEKADLRRQLTEASRAMTRKEFEALGRQVGARLDKLDKAIEVIAKFTLSDKEIEDEAPPPQTAYDHYKKIVETPQTEKVQPPVSEDTPQVLEIRKKVLQLVGENGKVKPEHRSVYLTVKGLWDDGDLDGCNEELDKVLKPKKAPIPGATVERVVGSGNVNRVFTRAEIANMSDADFAKNRDAIAKAQSEGRIK